MPHRAGVCNVPLTNILGETKHATVRLLYGRRTTTIYTGVQGAWTLKDKDGTDKHDRGHDEGYT